MESPRPRPSIPLPRHLPLPLCRPAIEGVGAIEGAGAIGDTVGDSDGEGMVRVGRDAAGVSFDNGAGAGTVGDTLVAADLIAEFRIIDKLVSK